MIKVEEVSRQQSEATYWLNEKLEHIQNEGHEVLRVDFSETKAVITYKENSDLICQYLERQIENLEERLKHLFNSTFVQKLDEKDPKTGEYRMDITKVDKFVKDQTEKAGTWEPSYGPGGTEPTRFICSRCYMEQNKRSNFCPNCGAPMSD